MMTAINYQQLNNDLLSAINKTLAEHGATEIHTAGLQRFQLEWCFDGVPTIIEQRIPKKIFDSPPE